MTILDFQAAPSEAQTKEMPKKELDALPNDIQRILALRTYIRLAADYEDADSIFSEFCEDVMDISRCKPSYTEKLNLIYALFPNVRAVSGPHKNEGKPDENTYIAVMSSIVDAKRR